MNAFILLHKATVQQLHENTKMLSFLDDVLIVSNFTFSFTSSPFATSSISVSSQLPIAIKVGLKWETAASHVSNPYSLSIIRIKELCLLTQRYVTDYLCW